GLRLRIEVVAEVVADAVVRGKKAGEHAGVRDERERTNGVGALKENGVLAQRVEVRRVHFRVAVRGEMIGAEGVDGDEDDRRLRIDGTAARAGGADGEECESGEKARTHAASSV